MNKGLSKKRVNEFTWKIENFCLDGDIFHKSINHVWKIIINGLVTEWRFNVSYATDSTLCYFERIDDNGLDNVKVSAEISCVAAGGKDDLILYFNENENFKKGVKEYILCDDLRKNKLLYFPDDSFTLRCLLWTNSSHLDPLNRCTAVTRQERKRIATQIQIPFFNDFCLRRERKVFLSEVGDYEIALYKEGLEGEVSDYITVDFSYTDMDGFCKCIWKEHISSERTSHECTSHEQISSELSSKGWNFKNIIDLKELNSLPDDALILQLEFIFFTGNKYTSVEYVENVPHRFSFLKTEIPKSNSDLVTQDLKELYMNKISADVKFVVGEETILAHRAILSARSPVFSAMFQSEMAEKKSGIVPIEDKSPEAFNKFLLFIYTGVVDDLDEETAMVLIELAHQYEVKLLVEKCGFYLKSIISIQNVFTILYCADLYEVEMLKSATQNFIESHHRKIFCTSEWKQFIKSHCLLASEIIEKISMKFLYYDF